MALRYKLPPTVTGSTWANVAAALWQGRPAVSTSDGVAPELSNREALAIVLAVRAETLVNSWPLWYQYAAAAYGWSPESDALNTSVLQADDQYADVQELVDEVTRLAASLDAASVKAPKLSIYDRWDDAAVQAGVSNALRGDGAQATFKVPIPACKDPVTGKPAKPIFDHSDRKWKCPGGMVTIDDPLTAIVKSLQPLVLPAVIISIAVAAFKTRGTRRKRKR